MARDMTNYQIYEIVKCIKR